MSMPTALPTDSSDLQADTKKFCCRYYHDGGWWSLVIDAYDFPDAKARADKLGLQLDGELVMIISARMSWAARVVVAFRNFFFR